MDITGASPIPPSAQQGPQSKSKKQSSSPLLPSADKIISHTEKFEAVKGAASGIKIAMKFATLQKTIPPLSALASTQPATQIISSLGAVASFLGLALCILNIVKKNRFITCLETLKKKQPLRKKDQDFFNEVISKQSNIIGMLSADFVKKHNIHKKRFPKLSKDDLDLMIEQLKYKRAMNVIAAIINIITVAIVIASFISAPPIWISFIPIILFLMAYIIEKKIDSEGKSPILDIFTPDFIKDLQKQDVFIKYLEFGDMHYWFRSNIATLAFYLTPEEMKLLEKEAKKIDEAIRKNGEDVDKLKQEFSKKCKEMLKAKTTRDKVQTIGTALFLGGAGLMLAPLSLWALAIIIPTIVIGSLLKFKSTLFVPTLGEPKNNPDTLTSEGAKGTWGLPLAGIISTQEE